VANGSFASVQVVVTQVSEDLADFMLEATAPALAQALVECTEATQVTIEVVVSLADIMVDEAIAEAETVEIPDTYPVDIPAPFEEAPPSG
jgi:hypothetical protein